MLKITLQFFNIGFFLAKLFIILKFALCRKLMQPFRFIYPLNKGMSWPAIHGKSANDIEVYGRLASQLINYEKTLFTFNHFPARNFLRLR